MRLMKVWLLFAMALVMTSGMASAQSTNGAISGRVVDQTDLPLPGVTVTVEGPNLQGPALDRDIGQWRLHRAAAALGLVHRDL